MTGATPHNHKLIFISHANPEDNEFTLWLAGRLASHGYLVWSDLTKLIGAEVFWNDIEDAIRNYSAKFVAVLSRISQQKDGVLDEVNIAVNVERSQKRPGFVVPIRLDDLPFNEVRGNIARKNIIDFSPGWANGLRQLLEVLERDGVPHTQEDAVAETSAWFARMAAGPHSIEAGTQTLLSNWAEITGLPDTLHFFRVPVKQNKVLGTFEGFAYPVYPFGDMIATFANEDEVNSGLSQFQKAMNAHDVPLKAILADGPHPLSQRLQWGHAANMISFIIRIAWDKAMANKGLHPYELSSGRKAWYPLDGYADGNWMRFTDLGGVERRKRLVGRSNQRKVNWHYAVEVVPSIRREPRVIFKPHVVFTEDGINPIESPTRMHSLRRGFCKNWWNERWRGLLLAYAAFIAEENGTVNLPVGDGQEFTIISRPLMFNAPVYLDGAGEAVLSEDETDSQLDEIAEDEDTAYDFEEDDEDVFSELDGNEAVQTEDPCDG